jgi:phospholipid transport system substrate-binding protein
MTMTRRTLSLAAAAFLFVAFAPPALAAPAQAAGSAATFIADLGRRAVEVLTQKQMSEAQREQKFRQLFEEGFDRGQVSRFVLGRYWNIATPMQQQEFERLFEDYVVRAYTVRFSEYTNQQFRVTGSRPQGEDTLVTSEIIRPEGGPPVRVDWIVANTARGPKITDVIVENVSMGITERQQFASVIQRNGGQIDALLKLLREKTGQG